MLISGSKQIIGPVAMDGTDKIIGFVGLTLGAKFLIARVFNSDLNIDTTIKAAASFDGLFAAAGGGHSVNPALDVDPDGNGFVCEITNQGTAGQKFLSICLPYIRIVGNGASGNVTVHLWPLYDLKHPNLSVIKDLPQ